MKTAITVKTREEGHQIQHGLDDPQVRAFVRVIGILRQLPNDRTRSMVMHFVEELNLLHEEEIGGTNGRDGESLGNY